MGSGYSMGMKENAVVCEEQCLTDPMYNVLDDPHISDILIVSAQVGFPDPVVQPPPPPPAPEPEPEVVKETPAITAAPVCEHDGYTCSCERKPDVSPFYHKPHQSLNKQLNPDYQWFDRDVYGFETFITDMCGWTEDGGFNVDPDSCWGDYIYLDQPGLWSYEDWEFWRFGIIIRDDQTNTTVSWTPIAGVNELTDDGDYLYRYAFKLPDEEVKYGEKYTPIYYDATGGSVTGDGQTHLDYFLDMPN